MVQVFLAISSAAREYDSFGNLIPNSSAGTWPGRFGYQGQAWLELLSGNSSQRLLLSPTRIFDPATGRFLQNEPLLTKRPRTHYLYANQNPVRFVDPLGLACGDAEEKKECDNTPSKTFDSRPSNLTRPKDAYKPWAIQTSAYWWKQQLLADIASTPIQGAPPSPQVPGDLERIGDKAIAIVGEPLYAIDDIIVGLTVAGANLFRDANNQIMVEDVPWKSSSSRGTAWQMSSGSTLSLIDRRESDFLWNVLTLGTKSAWERDKAAYDAYMRGDIDEAQLRARMLDVAEDLALQAFLAKGAERYAPVLEQKFRDLTYCPPAQVTLNRAHGNAFRDEVAMAFESSGAQVRLERYFSTLFGKRFIDVDVWREGVNLGGVETKVGNSPYTPLQRAKDAYLRIVYDYIVTIARRR